MLGEGIDTLWRAEVADGALVRWCDVFGGGRRASLF